MRGPVHKYVFTKHFRDRIEMQSNVLAQMKFKSCACACMLVCMCVIHSFMCEKLESCASLNTCELARSSKHHSNHISRTGTDEVKQRRIGGVGEVRRKRECSHKNLAINIECIVLALMHQSTDKSALFRRRLMK